MNRPTHLLFTSGLPRMARSVAPKSVHLKCGKGTVDRRCAARSSMQLKARMLQIALDPSTHPLPTSGLSITARSEESPLLVAAEAFTELECEGKEVPSLARESRTARGSNLNDAGLQGEYTNGYKWSVRTHVSTCSGRASGP